MVLLSSSMNVARRGKSNQNVILSKARPRRAFSADWDEDNEDFSSSQQGDESESESEDEATNLAFMALDDAPNELSISY